MKNIQIQDVLKKIGFITFYGNKSAEIASIEQINEHNKDPLVLSWCSDSNKEILNNVKEGTFIISNNIDTKYFKTNCNYIVVKNPRSAFQEVLFNFFYEQETHYISKSAVIDKSSIIGNNASIGENVVIEKACKIGDNVIIKHNTVILKNTIIGNSVVIGANTTIGGIGFGYEKDKNGDFKLIPHIGNVVIKNNVEIGNNTTIDRAVLGSTLLNDNVKVDNLVHIAHGVQVGRNSVVIANSMIAGSVVIGEDSWISPSSSILNKKSVGNNSLVGMGAVVIKDVGNNEIVAGNPSKILNKK